MRDQTVRVLSNSRPHPGLKIVSVNGKRVGAAGAAVVTELKKTRMAVIGLLPSPGLYEAAQDAGTALATPDSSSTSAATPAAGVAGTDGRVLVTIPKGKAGFGIRFEGPKDMAEAAQHGHGMIIVGVKPGSPADQAANMQINMQVMAVNGTDVSSATRDGLATVLNDVGPVLELELAENAALCEKYHALRAANRFPEASPAAVPQPSSPPVDAAMTEKAEEATAFLLQLGANHTDDATAEIGSTTKPVKTTADDMYTGSSEEEEGENAAATGGNTTNSGAQDRPGPDYSMAQNRPAPEYSMARNGDSGQLIYDSAMGSDVGSTPLDQSLYSVPIKIARPADVIYSDMDLDGAAAHTAPIRVLLSKGPKGYGISFGGAKDSAEADSRGAGIFIAKTTPGSNADSHPKIKVGLQIVSVNGTNLLNGSLKELRGAVLAGPKTELTLELCENASLAAAYAAPGNTAAVSGKTGTVGARREAEKTTPVYGEAARLGGVSGAFQNEAAGLTHEALASDNDPSSTTPAMQSTLSVTITKSSTGFGLGFDGARDDTEGRSHGFGLYVSFVKPNSAAAMAGGVDVGLQLVSMNGTDMSRATLATLIPAVQAVGTSMVVELTANPQLVAAYTELRKQTNLSLPNPAIAAVTAPGASQRVTVKRGPAGFGIIFDGAQNEAEAQTYGAGLYISALKPGSSAAGVDGMSAGLQIVSINGVDFTDGTMAELKVIARSFGDAIELVLQENPVFVSSYRRLRSVPKPGTTGPLAVAGEARSKPGSVHSVVIAKKPGAGFGITIGAGAGSTKVAGSTYVTTIKPGQATAAAFAAAGITADDGLRVMRIDGANLENGTPQLCAKQMVGKFECTMVVKCDPVGYVPAAAKMHLHVPK